MPSPLSQLISEIAARQIDVQNHPERWAKLRLLQTWQSVRLQRTYNDFYNTPRYRDALEFFIRDLYGPQDFTDRNHELGKVLGKWERVLPEKAVLAISGALQLEALSLSLDIDVVEKLSNSPLDENVYAAAYRAADRRKDRLLQIGLILQAGEALNGLIKTPWVQPALRVARHPARLLGVMRLHEFLERGFAAFSKMQDAQPLLAEIRSREIAIMKNLFEARPHPFKVDEAAARAPA
jgi:hypothetical protein